MVCTLKNGVYFEDGSFEKKVLIIGADSLLSIKNVR